MSHHDAPPFPEGWKVDHEAQRATLAATSPDFLAALALFRDVGEVAERLEHHPDLHLEGWNKVRIVTYSHDVGKLTARDERLATEISELLRKRGWKTE